MAVQALHTAATGLEALQLRLDVIANNLANVNTDGFKKSRANFEDLFYRHLRVPGIEDQQGQRTGTGTAIGLGTQISSTQVNFEEGNLRETSRALDVAIVGRGFFQVQDGGQILYSRAGNFTLNANGELVMGSANRGRLLEPSIVIPPDAVEIEIAPGGQVSVRLFGNPTLSQVGEIQLASFVNPQGLLQVGENLYAETDASGAATVGQPGGTEGLGFLKQRFLETSNVEPVQELVDLITTQRAFEFNSQVVKAADFAMEVIANLRRF